MVLDDRRAFFLVSLSTSILTIAVHNLFQPYKDKSVNAFVTINHWLVFLLVLILLLSDTSMFSGESYWMADFTLVAVTLVLVLMLVLVGVRS